MSAAPQHQPHGRRIRCPGCYRAYVPEPLPPRFEWSAGLAAALSAADRAVGRLAGEGRRLPNPHLLIRPFVRREAVLSSRIEGTQATLGELLAAEAGAAVARSPADLREVANYVVALEYGVERRHAAAVVAARAGAAPAAHAWGAGRRRNARRFPAQPELDRPGGMHARRRHLRAAATRPPHGVPRRLGEVPARRDAPPTRSCRARALAVRSHPPLPRRQRARRTAAHHAAAHRQGRAALAAPLPERLLRGHARGVLRAPARRDGARRVEGVARILPRRRGAAGRGRARPHPAHRRAARQLAGAARESAVAPARESPRSLRRES